MTEKNFKIPPGSTESFWGDYFSKHEETSESIAVGLAALINTHRFDQAAAFIREAVKHVKAEAWMYEGLATALEASQAPEAEVRAALVQAADLVELDPVAQARIAMKLNRHGEPRRALALFQQTAHDVPSDPLAYLEALKIAWELKDPKAMDWAACGLLKQAWPRENAQLQDQARQAVTMLYDELRKQGRKDEAERLMHDARLADIRDLVVRISWKENADIDLIVKDPMGSECRWRNPQVMGGGVLLGDGRGKNAEENYVCTEGLAGEYRITVHKVWGPADGRPVPVLLQVAQHWNAPNVEMHEQKIVLGEKDFKLTVLLDRGRRDAKHPMFVPRATQIRGAAGAKPKAKSRAIVIQQQASAAGPVGGGGVGAATQQAFQVGGATVGGGAVAFSPTIAVLQQGASLTAQAVVSADRRYVRLTLVPVFTTFAPGPTFTVVGAAGGR